MGYYSCVQDNQGEFKEFFFANNYSQNIQGMKVPFIHLPSENRCRQVDICLARTFAILQLTVSLH